MSELASKIDELLPLIIGVQQCDVDDFFLEDAMSLARGRAKGRGDIRFEYIGNGFIKFTWDPINGELLGEGPRSGRHDDGRAYYLSRILGDEWWSSNEGDWEAALQVGAKSCGRSLEARIHNALNLGWVVPFVRQGADIGHIQVAGMGTMLEVSIFQRALRAPVRLENHEMPSRELRSLAEAGFQAAKIAGDHRTALDYLKILEPKRPDEDMFELIGLDFADVPPGVESHGNNALGTLHLKADPKPNASVIVDREVLRFVHWYEGQGKRPPGSKDRLNWIKAYLGITNEDERRKLINQHAPTNWTRTPNQQT